MLLRTLYAIAIVGGFTPLSAHVMTYSKFTSHSNRTPTADHDIQASVSTKSSLSNAIRGNPLCGKLNTESGAGASPDDGEFMSGNPDDISKKSLMPRTMPGDTSIEIIGTEACGLPIHSDIPDVKVNTKSESDATAPAQYRWPTREATIRRRSHADIYIKNRNKNDAIDLLAKSVRYCASLNHPRGKWPLS